MKLFSPVCLIFVLYLVCLVNFHEMSEKDDTPYRIKKQSYFRVVWILICKIFIK